MAPRGYDHPLYILPFDHRGSFETGMFGWHGDLTTEQTAKIAEAKRVIYDGFRAALAGGLPKEHAGLLTDEQFGASILIDAKAEGYIIACPAEKAARKNSTSIRRRFCRISRSSTPRSSKVLVRYNPSGDATESRAGRQLKRLSDYLSGANRSLFMFELLVPAEKSQLAQVNGDKTRYDLELRPGLMVEALRELQDAGVEPDVWKIEGLDRREDCEAIVAVARRDGRDKVGCIILGRGENDAKVREWLSTAASSASPSAH